MEFIEKIEKAIDIEYDSRIEEFNEMKNIPIEERVLKGDAIDNVSITIKFPSPKIAGAVNNPGGGVRVIFDHNFIEFTRVIANCENNISKFRVGSYVLLEIPRKLVQ